MNMNGRGWALALTLVLATACGDAEADPATEVEGATGAAVDAAAADAGSGMAALTDLDRGVALARAIRASPETADAILAAEGLTRAGLDSLMFAIASDPASARAFTDAIR